MGLLAVITGLVALSVREAMTLVIIPLVWGICYFRRLNYIGHFGAPEDGKADISSAIAQMNK